MNTANLRALDVPTRTRLGRRFALLWTANTVTCIGDGVLLAAGPLLALSLTTDPRIVATTEIAVSLPYLIFGVLGGVLVDRTEHRHAMVTVDLARAAVLVLVTLAIVLGIAPIPTLLISLFILSSADTVYRTAAQAVLPTIVEADALVTANSRLMAAETTGQEFVGPALGGLLFVWAMSLPFLVDGASFALSGLLIVLALPKARPPSMAAPRRPRAGARTPLREAAEGARWLWQQAPIRFLAGASALINFFTAGTNAVIVIYVHDILHSNAIGFGVIESCAAAGGVLAGFTAGKIAQRLGTRNTLALAVTLQAMSQSLLFGTSNRNLTILALAAASFATVQFSCVSLSLRQVLIPPALRGRVMGLYRMLAWASLPIGALVSGIVVEATGLRVMFAVGASAMTALAVAIIVQAKTYQLTER